MAKNEKPTSKDFDETKAAKQKLKAAEKAKTPDAKKDKAEKAPKAKKFRRFWKDFRGEIKKIVWPDFKTVLKNAGIVLLTTAIIGIPVWILDYALSEGVLGLKTLAQGAKTTQAAPAETTAAEFDLEDFLAQTTAAPAEDETEPVTEPDEQPVTEPVTEPAE